MMMMMMMMMRMGRLVLAAWVVASAQSLLVGAPSSKTCGRSGLVPKAASSATRAAPDLSVEGLKPRLFAACAAADRGFAASAADRVAIEATIADLAELNPTANATAGCNNAGTFDAPLRKCWRLVYTSASDVSSLSSNPLVGVGAIYQDARQLPVVVNVIESFPRALGLLAPTLQQDLATSSLLKVKTRARARSKTRVGLTFEAIEFVPRALLGMEPPSWLPKVEFPLPQLGLDLQRQIFGVAADEDPRDASPAYFDVLFLDDDLLIIRQASPGGIFAAVAVDDDLS